MEKLEASGIVARYEKELEDVYGRLDAKDEYAGLLSGVKKDMDTGNALLRKEIVSLCVHNKRKVSRLMCLSLISQHRDDRTLGKG